MMVYAIDKFLKMVDRLNHEVDKHFTAIITINTNAVNISDNLFDILKNNSSNIQMIFSFDGIWHDKYRLDHYGNKTMQRAEENIRKFRDAGFPINITMVTPPEEMYRFTESIDYIINAFGNETNINPSFVRGAIPGVKSIAVYPGVLEQQYTNKIINGWADSVVKLIKEGKNIYWQRFLNRIREGGYKYRCPAMMHEYCVTPSGDVFPCHNLTEDSYYLGNITDQNFDITNNNAILNQFENRIASKLSPCKDCLFQTICLSSFDCPAHSLHDLGNFYQVDDKFCNASKMILTALLDRFIKNMEIK
jgi:radical SAM protein with 4Fe4S-binding SPASM domain